MQDERFERSGVEGREPRAVRTIARLLVLALITSSAIPAAAQDRIRYYHTDAVGNVRVITDESGAVVERHDYLPFGEEWNPGSAGQPLRFTGKERDAETGLDYFGARYYSAPVARFTTVDPLMTFEENLVDPQRWNRYAYARNNPLKYRDPDGRAVDVIADIGFVTFDIIDIGTSLYTGQGVTGTQIASLAGDIVGVAVPFLTGVGVAIKAAGKADNAVDAGRVVAGRRPISMDEAIEHAARHVDGRGVAEVTGGGRNLQFRNTTTNAAGHTETRIGRFDINPADPHVRRSGPHLNIETQVDGRKVGDTHTPIDPATIRPGDHP